MQHVSTADVQQFLAGIDYPKSKQELVDYARSQGAPDKVIDLMQQMEDMEFRNPTDVSKSIGKLK
ncbi:MAG: DUF2795 domain-containing protein [Chloroflexi bacterium]|nr:DUF2795 domain-containing protein [Chloroflexota bacterium]